MKGTKINKQAIIWRIEGLQGVSSEETRMTMMLNPVNIDFSYAPIVNETRTLGGFIQEFWGEQLTSLSASGKTSMFYNDKGLTNKDARKSEAYLNFIKLVNIYKNNGKNYDDDRKSSSIKLNQNRIKSVGIIIMTYINKQYEGYFDNFSIKEMSEKPYNYEYDFSFKITRTIGDLVVQSGKFL